jgi:hypothetical protein
MGHLHEYSGLNGNRDSSVGIATGYGLDDRGVGVPVQVGLRISLFRIVQTGCGAHPASYQKGTGVKAAGAWSHSSPTSAEFKKMWIYTSTPP